MLDKFDSERRATRLRGSGHAGLPLLSLHGEHDEIAPIQFGRRIFDAMPAPRKRFVELSDTGHNDVPYRDAPRYLREVASFLVAEQARRVDE